MSGQPAARCAACSLELAPALLACPGCGTLVHRERLQQIAAAATAAKQQQDISAELAAWRDALVLLPPNSQQHKQIAERIDVLSHASDRLPAAAKPGSSAGGRAGAALGILGTLALLGWKFKALVVLALTKGKLLLFGLAKGSTLFSMFAALGVYWSLWGWKFALGLIASIYIHEMGHVAALRRLGLKADAPMFIPGLGAVILMKQYPQTPREDARVGLAGPMWGLGAALAALGVFLAGGGLIWGAIAKVGAWINLFNMIPVWQLDGSRGFRALAGWQRGAIVLLIFASWYILGVAQIPGLSQADGLLLLVGIVAAGRALLERAPDSGDTRAFLQFAFLAVAHTTLASLHIPLPV
ncbi:MAG: site-2 protease family protein [Phycisphaerae bacterium]|nr:site-2 protease family protein [Phycisphaerae bacterium]